jgi:hypothetical protein
VGAKKSVASEPTPPNAKVARRLKPGEAAEAPNRVLECPGCAQSYLIEPHKDVIDGRTGAVKIGTTLHFDFACGVCKYEAAMGLT